MGFASEWLQSGPVFPQLIKEAPDIRTGIIIVVPAFDEPGILNLLESLASCRRAGCQTEVIIVFNTPAGADEKSLESNRVSFEKARSWNNSGKPHFRLYLINLEKPEVKNWGVGLARKAGMDEALRRFDKTGKEDGIIACLDADCTVEENYLLAIEAELLNRPERKACSVYFEHPVSGTDYAPEIYNAAMQYEIHLRYYFQALKYSGFPYVFHTVGSTIAVRALSYMKAGGMNRRQAGEDFYFIQKLVPSGGFCSLNSTTVFPSPRISSRVPFGTGAAIGKMIRHSDRELPTYHPKAFSDLKIFFLMNELVYSLEDERYEELYPGFPDSIRSFVNPEEWKTRLNEIKENTSSQTAFIKRFFEWFNMFRVVKYLNFVHLELFQKVAVCDACFELLKLAGHTQPGGDASNLLIYLRKIEKG